MKRIFCLIFLYCHSLVLFSNINKRTNLSLEIPSGTAIFVALGQKTLAPNIQKGDVLDFYVTQEIKINGTTIVVKDAKAIGIIMGIEAETKDFPAHLFIEVHQVQAINGEMIKVHGGKMFFVQNPSTAPFLTRVQSKFSFFLAKFR